MNKQNPNLLERTIRRAGAMAPLSLGAAVVMASAACTEAPPAAEPPTPSWKQTFEPVPAAVEVSQDVAKPKATVPTPAAKPKPAKAPAVVIAVAHADEGIDYGAKARDLMDNGDLKGALVAMRKHLHTEKPTADLLLITGRLARQTKKLSLAEAALEKGLAEDATRGDLAVELARVHMAAGKAKKAEKAARRALRANRNDASAWNQLGRSAMARSRWELAEVAFGRAVHLDPIDGLIHNNYGLLYIYMKKGPQAVDALERAVELLDEDAPYYVFNNLGLAHELAGQYEEAREAFEEALHLNPFYPRAKVNLDRVSARIASVEEPATDVEPSAVDLDADADEPSLRIDSTPGATPHGL